MIEICPLNGFQCSGDAQMVVGSRRIGQHEFGLGISMIAMRRRICFAIASQCPTSSGGSFRDLKHVETCWKGMERIAFWSSWLEPD